MWNKFPAEILNSRFCDFSSMEEGTGMLQNVFFLEFSHQSGRVVGSKFQQ